MILLAAILALGAFDSEALPFDYIRPTAGGKYVFVMLRPEARRRPASGYTEYASSYVFKAKQKSGALFKKYPASGLYRKGSKKPLWTVDWYSFDAIACSDGEHLVRFGPWPRTRDEGRTLAVAFYRSGKEIVSFAVKDIITDLDTLPHSVSHYRWMTGRNFDDKGKRLIVNIAADFVVEFDIRTGRAIT